MKELKINYNGTPSGTLSLDELETRLNKNSEVTINYNYSFNDTHFQNNVSSGKLQAFSVPDVNYESFTKYTRDFYKGKSFHFSGEWTPGIHYVNDEYDCDFVTYRNTLLVCNKTHLSSLQNEPNLIYDESQNPVGVLSEYWTFICGDGLNINKDYTKSQLEESLMQDNIDGDPIILGTIYIAKDGNGIYNAVKINDSLCLVRIASYPTTNSDAQQIWSILQGIMPAASITQSEIDAWNAVVALGITSEEVDAWNNVLNRVSIIEEKPAMTITDADISAWNAVIAKVNEDLEPRVQDLEDLTNEACIWKNELKN